MEDHTNKESNYKLKVVKFPWFAFGHINPFVQLSNTLFIHDIQIYFLSIPGNVPRIKLSLQQSPLMQIIPLTIPPVEGLRPDFDSSSDVTPETSELLKLALDKMQPQVENILTQFQPNLVVFDFAQYWIPKLASKMGIKSIKFSVYSAVSNSYLTIPSRMADPNKPPSIEALKNPPLGFPKTSITAMKTFQAQDFMYLFKSFHGKLPVFERIMEIINSCDAIIYKSCNEIEGPYLNYLKTQFKKPILLSGIAVNQPPTDVFDHEFKNWLNTFSEKSVIFCNFGSETYLKDDQIKELTLGLELTKMPFFLVLNFGCNDFDSRAKLEAALPKGYRNRVKDRGVVVTGWVQQQHILGHKNVGCYINHCGFSSAIEGIVNDCQMVFVPQKGDQFLNSKLMTEDLKVGVEVNRRDEDGFFGKEDVVEAIHRVMVDIDDELCVSIRENHRKWREFLLNKEVEDQYVVDLVKSLHNLAST
ncbi:hypothetical protein RND81_05G226100 [Saponaria officinalis]|uniref:Uncharacterized protein n=1 Tax=Saponaria officinalis TaxID=3572 RepID=A0AAW1L348_SAPOF